MDTQEGAQTRARAQGERTGFTLTCMSAYERICIASGPPRLNIAARPSARALKTTRVDPGRLGRPCEWLGSGWRLRLLVLCREYVIARGIGTIIS